MLPKLFHIISYYVNDANTPITLDSDPDDGGEGKPAPSDMGS